MDVEEQWWKPFEVIRTLLFSVGVEVQSDLNNGTISEDLRQKFTKKGIPLSDNVSVSVETDASWLVTSGDAAYIIRRQEDKLNIYGKTILHLHGKKGKRRAVKADDVLKKMLKAIKLGWDIDIDYAVIYGGIDIREAGLDKDEQGKRIIAGEVSITNSIFNSMTYFEGVRFKQEVDFGGTSFEGEAIFVGAKFKQKANFVGASFQQKANFRKARFKQLANFRVASFEKRAYFKEAKFKQKANFSEASFEQSTDFSGASFRQTANFAGVMMKYPASFAEVDIDENTTKIGLYNDIRCRKKPLSKKPVTDIYSINTETVIDGSSNPYLKRYIDDEQWIKSWRDRGGWGTEKAFLVWEGMSHCGRSIGLWAGWSVFVILFFSVIFTPSPHCWPNWWWGFWREHGIAFRQTTLPYDGKPVNFLSCLYFSIVNFTTLGFGDIVAANWQARFWVAFEVVLGYVMLGGLISIFANKFARRS